MLNIYVTTLYFY